MPLEDLPRHQGQRQCIHPRSLGVHLYQYLPVRRSQPGLGNGAYYRFPWVFLPGRVRSLSSSLSRDRLIALAALSLHSLNIYR